MIRKALKEFGFSHRQGSGYRSDKPMTRMEAENFVRFFSAANSWLGECVKVFDVTNSGKTDYSFADVIRSETAKCTSESVVGSNSKTTAPSFVDMARAIKTESRTALVGSNAFSNENIND